MHPSTNGALPVVDFGGEDLPPVAVELLQADVAVALLREAVKLYRRGTQHVETRGVLQMPVLGDLDNTSPADAEAAIGQAYL